VRNVPQPGVGKISGTVTYRTDSSRIRDVASGHSSAFEGEPNG
jgi:hypothetical protein